MTGPVGFAWESHEIFRTLIGRTFLMHPINGLVCGFLLTDEQADEAPGLFGLVGVFSGFDGLKVENVLHGYTLRLIQKSHPQPKTPTPAPPKTPAHTTPTAA